MIRSLARATWWLAVAAMLGGGALAALARPTPLAAQTRCYIVACSGNVCVWKEVACPVPPQ